MKRTVYKITVFILLLCISVPLFAGCARESDEAFLTVAEGLLEKSKKVNEICFGKGLRGDENGYSAGGYLEAAEEDRVRYGVESTESILALVREIYSVSACDYINTVIFSPVQTGSSFVSYRRYFDTENEGQMYLMVKKDYEPLAVGDVTYQNVRISSHDRSRGEVLVDIIVTDAGRSREIKDVHIALRYEDGAWKLDTMTYASIH